MRTTSQQKWSRKFQKERRKWNQEHPNEALLLRNIREAKRKERANAKELRAKVRVEKKKLRALKAKERKLEEYRNNPRKFLRRMAPWLKLPEKSKTKADLVKALEKETKDA